MRRGSKLGFFAGPALKAFGVLVVVGAAIGTVAALAAGGVTAGAAVLIGAGAGLGAAIVGLGGLAVGGALGLVAGLSFFKQGEGFNGFGNGAFALIGGLAIGGLAGGVYGGVEGYKMAEDIIRSGGKPSAVTNVTPGFNAVSQVQHEEQSQYQLERTVFKFSQMVAKNR